MYTFDYILAFSLLVTVVILLCIMLYAFVTKKPVKPDNDIIELVQHYKQWNAMITTKQGMLDFYKLMDEMCREVWSTEFKLQITKEEFNQLPLDTLKQLNDQALDTLCQLIDTKKGRFNLPY